MVIPTYNRAALLAQALQSVFACLGAEDEIVVVDDGSTDHTVDIVNDANAPWHAQVRYLAVPNAGAGAARNAGIAAARHDLIAFADSDDVWLPWRLSLQRPVMAHPDGPAYCFTNFSQMLEDGSTTPHWLVEWSEDARSWDDILAPGFRYADRWTLPPDLPASDHGLTVHVGSMYRQELEANYINVNTLLARRSLLGAALQFGVGLPTYEDWECFARIAACGPCAYIDVDTAMQRAHPGPRLTSASILTRTETRLRIIERTWAQDAAFLAEHGDVLQAVLRQLRATLLRQLIVTRQRERARVHAATFGAGLKDRIALALPAALVDRLLQQT